jgi:hypothetical protein
MLSTIIENEIQDAWILASRLAGKLHTIVALHRGPGTDPLIKATKETIQAIEEIESLIAWPLAEIKEGAR